MKDMIRTNLKMLEDNLDHFNDYSLQFCDKKAIKRHISVWRWYVSHGYFKDEHPQPEGIASNPPIPWLNGELIGRSTPIYRDIALCIEPVVNSSLMTEQAARRIMNRLSMIHAYVTPEAAKADQVAMHKIKVLDKLSAKKHAEYMKAERDKKRLKPPTEAEYKKAGDDYLKEKVAYRKKRHKELTDRKERALNEFKNQTRRIRERGN